MPDSQKPEQSQFKENPSKRAIAMEDTKELMVDHKLWIKILIGMFFGVIFGALLSPHGIDLLTLEKETAYAIGEWVALPGIIFLKLIQMVIIPLIFCSIVLGIAKSNDMGFLRNIAIRLIPYFIVTTTIAILIGLSFVHIIKPGQVIDSALVQEAMSSGAADGSLPDQTFEDLTIPQRIGNLIPDNPAQAQVDRNLLQIVIASILIGVALITLPKGPAALGFKELCRAGQMLSMKIIGWAMMIAPYAVFGLLANITIRIGFNSLLSMGLYMGTVLCALAMMLAVYFIIISLFTKIKIGAFIKGIREVQLLAFSTSSSAATMPFTIQAAEEKLNVREEISRFVVPLGATINMDGTALYQCVAAIFLCQVFGVDLSATEVALLVVTTVGASIGTPATPGVGIVVLATILIGIGVPAEGIALIIGVDRILDMCRTTINVTGDLTASAVMNQWLKP